VARKGTRNMSAKFPGIPNTIYKLKPVLVDAVPQRKKMLLYSLSKK